MIIVYEQNMLDDKRIVSLLHKNDYMPYIKYKDLKGGGIMNINEYGTTYDYVINEQ
jgi:hypothetical protein